MAKVTYRGVSYDTDTRKQAANTTQVQETYRVLSSKRNLLLLNNQGGLHTPFFNV